MEPAAPKKPFRVLTLDGGGTWALVQGKALGAIYGENTDGWTILDRFDLAAANSGGSLVLAMLLKGMTPAEIVALFASRRERELIFERNGVVDRAIGGLFGFAPRYNAPSKLAGLRDIFKRSSGRWGPGFGALPLDLVAAGLNAERAQRGLGPFQFLITAFDFDAERSVFFRSDPNSAAAHFRGAPVPTIAGALHAATNAPVRYFNRPAHVEFTDGTAINGVHGTSSGAGSLYHNSKIAIEAMPDGSSNTLVVSEQSDVFTDVNNAQKPRWAAGGIYGWTMGFGAAAPSTGENRHFNCTTVRYQINYKKNRAEGSAAGLRSVHDDRIASARERLDDAESRLRDDREIRIDLPGTEVPRGRVVLEGDLPISGPDRVALVGPNGSGKTTLLHALVEDAQVPVGLLPQRLDLQLERRLSVQGV